MKYLSDLAKALKAAQAKHPSFPKDILHQVAILAEESGEVAQAAVDYTYGGDRSGAFREEVLDVMVVCYRMLEALDNKGTWAQPERGVK